MNLTSTQIKDTYGNLVTIGTVAGTPTTGVIQNGAGSTITALTMTNTTLEGGLVVNESGADVDFRVEGDTDQNLLFVDASADRVGIGTSSPDTLLNLSSSATDGSVIRLENTDVSIIQDQALGSIEFYSNDVSTGGTGVKGELKVLADTAFGQNYAMTFSTGTTTGGVSVLNEGMRIDSEGRVGIGTNAPGSLLDVQSSSAVGAISITATTGTNGSAIVAQNTGGTSYFGRNNSTGGAFGGAAYATVVYGGGAYPLSLYTNDLERLRIDSSGNFIFNENGNDSDFRVEGDTDTHLIFADAGNDRVGIGTSSPQATFQVSGTTCVSDIYYIFTASASTAQSNTHTITIPFTSQGVQYSAWVVEIIYASSWGAGVSATYSGKASYAFNSLTTLYDLAELEDTGQRISFSASISGMNLIITATSTATAGQEPDRISAVARITRGNVNVSNRPTGMTIA